MSLKDKWAGLPFFTQKNACSKHLFSASWMCLGHAGSERVEWGEEGRRRGGRSMHPAHWPLSGVFLPSSPPRGQMPAGKLWLPSCSDSRQRISEPSVWMWGRRGALRTESLQTREASH